MAYPGAHTAGSTSTNAAPGPDITPFEAKIYRNILPAAEREPKQKIIPLQRIPGHPGSGTEGCSIDGCSSTTGNI